MSRNKGPMTERAVRRYVKLELMKIDDKLIRARDALEAAIGRMDSLHSFVDDYWPGHEERRQLKREAKRGMKVIEAKPDGG